MTSGFGVAPWVRTVPGGDLGSVRACWSRGPSRGSACRRRRGVVSCYEAGRDGFWIHRALAAARDRESGGGFGEHRGESPRAAREDGSAGCVEIGDGCWCGSCSGERGVWREVRVPTVADEAARQVSRERTELIAGADAAASIRCAAGWRRGAARCRPAGRRRGGRGARLGGRGAAGARCKRDSRARRRGWRLLDEQIAALEATAARRDDGGGADECRWGGWCG